nr:type IV toxin-antitoxin system AbiEi family antitoxin [Sansalvadorimonas verongulae]
MGVSRGLAKKYVEGGWITSIGYGAYARKGDNPLWPGALSALQQQGKVIWVGGVYALSLHSLIHYLPLGRETITLFGPSGTQLPKWVQDYNWSAKLLWQTTPLWPVHRGMTDNSGLAEKHVQGFTVWVSSPERAALEMLQGVPKKWSFDFAAEVMQGATHLSPRKLQGLLETCSSIQAKRLFLFLAEYYQHKWLERLDLTRINLGRGKRQIVTGGTFNSKWNITVPTKFQKPQGSHP